MKLRKNRRRLPAGMRSRGFLEALEPRMVMDAAMGGDPDVFPSEDGTIEISLMSEMSERSWNDGTLAVSMLESDSLVFDPPAVPVPPALQHFSTADALQQHLVTQAVAQWKELFGTTAPRYDFGPPFYRHGFLEFASGGSGLSWNNSLAFARETDANYSNTNVQVAGVDEGDLVKTDGKYLYIIREQRLTIVDVRDPRQMQIVSRTSLSQYANELYLDGDRLTVISRSGFMSTVPAMVNIDPLTVIDAWPSSSWKPTIQVEVFDIRDRTNPQEVASFQLDGTLVQSRSVGDRLVLVTQDDVSLPPPKLDCKAEDSNDSGVIGRMVPGDVFVDRMWHPWLPEPQSCVYETEEAYVARVSDGLLARILPHYSAGDNTDQAPGFLTAAESVVATGLLGSQLVSTTVIDVGADTPVIVDSAGVLAPNAFQVYATADHVYVTAGEWGGWWASQESTHIVQFSLDEALGSVDVTAIGSVTGHLLNQFAMDEHEGFLRVATTQGFGETATNNVFVLQRNDERLGVVGKATGITPGESIFAARFLGDRAFLVTFQRTDPVVALDLSKPTDPVVAGELEIPGFSNYLHPVAEGYLLGLGRDANPLNGWGTDPQISLFDVADLTNPQLLDRETIAGGAQAWSPGFFDHHAISFFEEAGLFAVPFNLPEWELGGLADFWNWNAGTVINAIGLPQIELAVDHFSEELDPKFALELVRQYFPDSFRDLLPEELPSVEAIREFLKSLPDDLKVEDAVDQIRQFVKDWSGESSDRPLSVEELRKRVADLPEHGKGLIKRFRGHLPSSLQRLAATILGEEDPVPQPQRPRTGLWLFHIDPSAKNPIERVGVISHAQPVDRSVQVGDTLFTISHDSVQAHHLLKLGQPLGELFIGRQTVDDFVTVDIDGGSQEIDVLANDRLPKDATIIAVSEPSEGGTVTVSDDGRTLLYTPPKKLVGKMPIAEESSSKRQLLVNDIFNPIIPFLPIFESRDHFSYTVKLPDGSTESAEVHVQLVQTRAGLRMAQLATEDLAKRLDIPADRVKVIHVEPRIWPDACLGIEQPDRSCAQGEVLGFIVWLSADERRYEYHTDSDSTVVLVKPNDPPPMSVVPDFFRVKQDSAANEFYVLANDFSNVSFIKAPEITAVSIPDHGGTVTIASDGLSLSYTPATGFHGVETFTYTVDNGPVGNVAVNVIPSEPDGGGGGGGGTNQTKLVGIRLEVTDSAGNPVSQIELGDSFLINVYVDDLRQDAEGVFGAYLDLEFDTRLANVTGDIQYAIDYANGVSGTVDRSGIDELGAFSGSLKPLGADERLLVSIPLEALTAGTLKIAANPADLLPHHETTVYGINAVISRKQIEYGSIDLVIVNSFHNEAEPTDANGDGVTTPTDALPIINWINEHGAVGVKQLRALERLAATAGAVYLRESRRFDTNDDGHCTHMDVLMIFNRVNEDSRRHAEAQAEAGKAAEPTVATVLSRRHESSHFLFGPFMPGSTSVARRDARLAAAESSMPTAAMPMMGHSSAEAEATGTGCPHETENLLDDLVNSSDQATMVDDFFAELGLPN